MRAEKEALSRRIKQVFVDLKKSPFVQVAAKRLSWLKTHRAEVAAYINHRYYRRHQTLLHCASKKGFILIVRWLVEQCFASLNIVDLNGNSALHLASAHGHRSIVEYLLGRGADPHLRNHEDLTAQQIAQRSNIDFSPVFRRVYDSNMFDMAEAGFISWFEHYFGENSPDTINEYGTTLLYVAC
jgi:ankyrin repeat protein